METGPFAALARAATRDGHRWRARLLDLDPRLLVGDPAYWVSDFGYAMARGAVPGLDFLAPRARHAEPARIRVGDLLVRVSGALYGSSGAAWRVQELGSEDFDRIAGLHLVTPPAPGAPFRFELRRRSGRLALPVRTTSDAVRTGSDRLVFAAEVIPGTRARRTPAHWEGEVTRAADGSARIRGRVRGAIRLPRVDGRPVRGYLDADFVALPMLPLQGARRPGGAPADHQRRELP